MKQKGSKSGATDDDNTNRSPKIYDELKVRTDMNQSVTGSPQLIELEEYLKAIYTTGEDAQETHDEILSRLRTEPADIIIEIARQEKACEPSDYSRRSALIYAAGQLRHPSSLPFLRNIVLTPIPPEKSEDAHSFSTVEEETILRTTAIEGIRYLAEQGNEEAVKTLYAFLEIPSISIRRASIQALLSNRKDEQTRRQISEMIPKEHQFLLDLRPAKVEDVPQIVDPTRHLKPANKSIEQINPPELPDANNSGKVSRAPKTPER
ncbi:MAG: HEAT repeat domain-containing protein [Nitrososphaeraceae archaeon]